MSLRARVLAKTDSNESNAEQCMRPVQGRLQLFWRGEPKEVRDEAICFGVAEYTHAERQAKLDVLGTLPGCNICERVVAVFSSVFR